MLVAYRLVGLSATKLYYAGVGIATQSGACGFRNGLGFQSP
jgi:hypothetical protein